MGSQGREWAHKAMDEKETNMKAGDLVAATALGNARFATKEPRTLPRTLTLLYIIVVFSAKDISL